MFGLGFKSLAAYGQNTPIDNAYEQGLISHKMFSFWLQKFPFTFLKYECRSSYLNISYIIK